MTSHPSYNANHDGIDASEIKSYMFWKRKNQSFPNYVFIW